MELISKAALAKHIGISRAAVTKAANTFLIDAVVDGKIDVDHKLVNEWLDTKGVPRLSKKKVVNRKPSPPSDVIEPVKIEDYIQPTPMPVDSEMPEDIGGIDINELEHLTLRQIVARYGTIDGFKRFVEALRNIADIKTRELKLEQQRGELVSRELMLGTVLALFEVMCKRLVTDVPDSTGILVTARVESGGKDTLDDVKKMIRDANSKAIKNTKQAIMKNKVLNK